LRKKKDEELEHPGRWLQLAQQEIGRRLKADAGEHAASIDRELEMQARLKAQYPDMPIGLVLEFSRQLEAGGFTSEAWENAVAWLEKTEWFVSRPS
jgi:hypothetical protein